MNKEQNKKTKKTFNTKIITLCLMGLLFIGLVSAGIADYFGQSTTTLAAWTVQTIPTDTPS